MGKYRKKPVVIEAVKWEGQDNEGKIYDFFIKSSSDTEVVFDEPLLRIKTLEGEMTAQPGDWVICGVKGELYPCKPDIFEATYEPVKEPS